MSIVVGTVKELWRYPVKSMGGEKVESTEILKQGLFADRGWAVRDDDIGEIKGGRKLPRLMGCNARYIEQPKISDSALPGVEITFPDKTVLTDTDPELQQKLSQFLKRPASLWPLQKSSNWAHYRLEKMMTSKELMRQFASPTRPDLSEISLLKLLELSFFATPVGRYYDAYPLHLMTTDSLQYMADVSPQADYDVRRFRPNILIDTHLSNEQGLSEFQWIGGKLHIGDVIIKISARTVRCSMPAQPQMACHKDSKVVKGLIDHSDRHLGVYAEVIKPGTIYCGDDIILSMPANSSVNRMLRPIKQTIKKRLVNGSLSTVDWLAKLRDSR